MSTLELTRPHRVSLTGGQLPKIAPYLVAAMALAASGLAAMMLGWGLVAWLVLAALLHVIGLPSWSFAIENRRKAVDRLMTSLVWGAFSLAVIPLVSLLWTVISEGSPRLGGDFFSKTQKVVGIDALLSGATSVGIHHAVIGSLLITAWASLISVPIGIFCAIYLVEYSNRNRLARIITFLVDVMTGIPSIVAGLFAFTVFTMIFGAAYRSGLGGAVALSLLMIPIVVRATEEMLRLVPTDLREASYALGTPKWRTIVKVVLPTALGGIVTGVTLAMARVIGETAPLLLIAGSFDDNNYNVFDGRMSTLPVFIFGENLQREDRPNAWGAALVLIGIVLLLNLVARVIGKIFAPAKG